MTRNIKADIMQKNDTSGNWTSSNPVLKKGQMGVETDTRKFKFGDGVTSWNRLEYAKTEKQVIESISNTEIDAILQI